MGEGMKFDGDKPRMELLDPGFLTGVAHVLTYGARKYAPNNWRGGIEASRLYGALQRHLNAFWAGEDIDAESGLPHLYHAGCELMFLANMWETRPDMDDRWRPEGANQCLYSKVSITRLPRTPIGRASRMR